MMFKKLKRTVSMVVTVSLVSTAAMFSAVPSHAGDKQAIGSLLGAAGGALIGSKIGKGKGQLAAVAVGTLLGAGVGSTLASESTHARPVKRHSSYRSTYYHNPGYHTDYGVYNSYYQQSYTPSYYVPVKQVQPQIMRVNQTMPINHAPINMHSSAKSASHINTSYCREFIMQNVNIAGKTQESYGTACMQPDGSWQIQP